MKGMDVCKLHYDAYHKHKYSTILYYNRIQHIKMLFITTYIRYICLLI